ALFSVDGLPPGTREPIDLRPAPVVRRCPRGSDPALLLEPLERGEHRARLDIKGVACELANTTRDAPPVLRFERERTKDQQIQRALEQVGGSIHVDCPVDSLSEHLK